MLERRKGVGELWGGVCWPLSGFYISPQVWKRSGFFPNYPISFLALPGPSAYLTLSWIFWGLLPLPSQIFSSIFSPALPFPFYVPTFGSYCARLTALLGHLASIVPVLVKRIPPGSFLPFPLIQQKGAGYSPGWPFPLSPLLSIV